MRINVELDEFEAEALFSLLHDAIVKHKQESRVKYLMEEIELDRHEWDIEHAKFLEGLKEKLLNSSHR